ncbi:hypothetical protein Q5Y75_11460 [Ruegeria sp. 2205SS24-7]|uniref:hypothetical protein n=1 Tax=Ruegeria discodermiae TaxID=3064389 RepID=UPI0027413447|nr:hypothetical protein [Ruegeria sp. 2205SS24-7]MDP5217839.1 hypothetical protein [Ruegeria sp. 2205SS24-7]
MANTSMTRRVKRLLSRLSIGLAVLAVLAAAAWGALRGANPIVDRMIEADIRHQSGVWQRQVTSFITNLQETFGEGEVAQQDLELLHLVPQTSDIFRLQIYDATGKPNWSSAGPHSHAPALHPERRGTTVSGETFFDLSSRSALEVL